MLSDRDLYLHAADVLGPDAPVHEVIGLVAELRARQLSGDDFAGVDGPRSPLHRARILGAKRAPQENEREALCTAAKAPTGAQAYAYLEGRAEYLRAQEHKGWRLDCLLSVRGGARATACARPA